MLGIKGKFPKLSVGTQNRKSQGQGKGQGIKNKTRKQEKDFLTDCVESHRDPTSSRTLFIRKRT